MVFNRMFKRSFYFGQPGRRAVQTKTTVSPARGCESPFQMYVGGKRRVSWIICGRVGERENKCNPYAV